MQDTKATTPQRGDEARYNFNGIENSLQTKERGRAHNRLRPKGAGEQTQKRKKRENDKATTVLVQSHGPNPPAITVDLETPRTITAIDSDPDILSHLEQEINQYFTTQKEEEEQRNRRKVQIICLATIISTLALLIAAVTSIVFSGPELAGVFIVLLFVTLICCFCSYCCCLP